MAPGLGAKHAPVANPSALDAIFAEDETPLELEEVVAQGTDPGREKPAAPPALLADDEGPDPFRRIEAPDATLALFGDAEDFSDPLPDYAGEDSAGDLDDLFKDLVKD